MGLATRKPMLLSSIVGTPRPRNEERKASSVRNQLPPRIARPSDEELFKPSKALSFHSHALPPWPIVPYGLKPPALSTRAGTEAALS
jgi:hypothetical protein